MRSSIPQDAAKLLLDRVSLQLQSGNCTVFNKMLLIMDYYGIATAKAISLEIRSKLSAFKYEDSNVSSSGQGKKTVAVYVYN